MKKLPLFYKIYFGVLAAFVIAAGIAVGWLNSYLPDFEAAQPQNVANEIFAKYYNSEGFDSLAVKCADGDVFEPSTAIAKYLHENYDSAELICTSGTKVDGKYNYVIKSGDKKVSSFTLKLSDKKSSRGLDVYEEDEFKLYIDTNSVTVLAPAGYTVSVNGVAVGEKFAVENDIPEEGAKLLPDGVSPIKYTRYKVDGIISEPKLSAKTSDGADAEVVYVENDKEYRVNPTFDKALEEKHKDFAFEAAQAYSRYMSNETYWGAVKGYFDPSSEIYEDAATSYTIFVETPDETRYDDAFVGEFYGYSAEVFSCRISFVHVRIVNGKEEKDFFNSTIFFRYVDDEWKICGMVNHA